MIIVTGKFQVQFRIRIHNLEFRILIRQKDTGPRRTGNTYSITYETEVKQLIRKIKVLVKMTWQLFPKHPLQLFLSIIEYMYRNSQSHTTIWYW
jgi:hypothetical protein